MNKNTFTLTPHIFKPASFGEGLYSFSPLRMYVCIYVCIHVCMYACMYVCKYVCMSVCMYACVYVSVCMYVCMCESRVSEDT